MAKYEREHKNINNLINATIPVPLFFVNIRELFHTVVIHGYTFLEIHIKFKDDFGNGIKIYNFLGQFPVIDELTEFVLDNFFDVTLIRFLKVGDSEVLVYPDRIIIRNDLELKEEIQKLIRD